MCKIGKGSTNYILRNGIRTNRYHRQPWEPAKSNISELSQFYRNRSKSGWSKRFESKLVGSIKIRVLHFRRIYFKCKLKTRKWFLFISYYLPTYLPTYLPSLNRLQCDQIWRFFASLVIFSKLWTRICLVFGNILNLFRQFYYAIGRIFHCCKGPNIDQIIKPSCHTDRILHSFCSSVLW